MSSFSLGISKNQEYSRDLSIPKSCDANLQKIFPGIVSFDIKMKNILRDLLKISPSNSPVLILGETGTGKELIAKAIHSHSGRPKNKLIAINCSAIPENILEAELFGYEKGAFTGADRTRPGIFDSLEGGTLFLDEIGDMPLRLQVKLLRVIQEKKYMSLGGRVEKTINIRFIAATNKDLEQEVQEKKFRSDLFYRLNVLPLYIPPLRERKSDIPLLIEFFINSFMVNNGKKILFELKKEVLDIFSEYSWPGNIRELCNFVERLCLMKDSGVVSEKDIPMEIKKEMSRYTISKRPITVKQSNHIEINLPETGIDLDVHLEEIGSFYIKEALLRTQNNKKEAAKLLSLNRTTLVERIKKRRLTGKW